MNDLIRFLPELSILLGALVTFGASMLGRQYAETWMLGVLSAVAACCFCVVTLPLPGDPFFPGIYTVDIFSQLLKGGLALGFLLTLLASDRPHTVRPSARVDLVTFFAVSTAGMMMLVSATELLTLYVALELSAYGMYIIAALHRAERRGSEAAAKYIVFGAASSAVTLYGMSLVYGVVQSTYLSDIVAFTAQGPNPMLIVGVLLMLAGFLFKLAVFPFHAWAPDTYEGAPHQVVTFIATASKVAAVGILARTLAMVSREPGELPQVLVILCVASMTFGNLAAIVQKDIKRLLAYSTVAHAGYMLIGLLTFSELGTASAVFYGLTYLVMGFLPFLVVCAVANDNKDTNENPTLDSIAGLSQRSPLLALTLLVGMFGLAGIPPTPGFAGKWFLFSAALEDERFILVLVAAINATISLYYYLQLVRAAYVKPPAEGAGEIRVSSAHKLAAGIGIAAVTVLGVYPQPLWRLAREAAQAVLGV